MPTSAEGRSPDRLVDTSVAVALLLGDHDQHELTFRAVGNLRLGLAGHAAFETYSVLTRLPAPARRTGATAARLLAVNFPASTFLDAEESQSLLKKLPSSGIAGGQVYDALVGMAARRHGITLATRDRRAADTYLRLDVDFELIADGS